MGDWHGYGIGGLSVGEAKPDMYRILEAVHDALARSFKALKRPGRRYQRVVGRGMHTKSVVIVWASTRTVA